MSIDAGAQDWAREIFHTRYFLQRRLAVRGNPYKICEGVVRRRRAAILGVPPSSRQFLSMLKSCATPAIKQRNAVGMVTLARPNKHQTTNK
jgi:hypothetical protein